ncbi:hypothetical protein PanWU01x14_215570 [Parasponia andersonii]|uniref:Uncharacterized protein n=1 Tax=Parasponia andersonii TaxID=3476 RepID=A0A2P5BRT3_PARAD|nr:hypothetical protein PanWU01x14_215570 [Parasponia andersonii]
MGNNCQTSNFDAGHGHEAAEKLVIGTDDVYTSAEAVNLVTKELGGKNNSTTRSNPHNQRQDHAFLGPEG